MGSKLTWQGKALSQELIAKLSAALDRHSLKIDAKAKLELYPGHGKLTGTLQRSISANPSRLEGRRIVGSVSTKGVPYARIIHRRYEYLTKGARAAGELKL